METTSTILAKAAIIVLDACQQMNTPIRQRLERDGIAVIIEAGPVDMMDTPAERAMLTESERDIIEIVQPGERKTGPEIRAALSKAEKIHGDSTISRALARLVHAGLLCNDHSKRGYWRP